MSNLAVNCCSEAQSIHFSWKQAIQQLSVKPHLQQIKSYTSKELAYSLLWLKSEKHTFTLLANWIHLLTTLYSFIS